jgi:ABC-type multidrug transport system fused ATPase/permease subunit
MYFTYLIGPYKKWWLLAFGASLLGALSFMGFARVLYELFQQSINTDTQSQTICWQAIQGPIVSILTCTIGMAAASVGRLYSTAQIWRKFQIDHKWRLVKCLQQLPPSDFQQMPLSYYKQLLLDDFEVVHHSLITPLPVMGRQFFLITTILLLMFYYQSIAATALTLLIGVLGFRKSTKPSSEKNKQVWGMWHSGVDKFLSLQSLFWQQNKPPLLLEKSLYAQANQEYADMLKKAKRMGGIILMAGIIMTIIFCMAMIFAPNLVIGLVFGGVVTLLTMNVFIENGLSLQKGAEAFGRVIGALKNHSCDYLIVKNPIIQVDNPVFTYDNKSVELPQKATIKPGTVVACVGPTGSGKSTILKGIAGLLTPQKGCVTYQEGALIKSPERVFGIEFIPPEPVLWGRTVHEALTLGEDYKESEIKKALSIAQLINMIDNLPKGWHTALDDDYLSLSTGQKQRLALARALLRNPAVLVLDEITSALDQSTAMALMTALRSCGKTLVLATHDNAVQDQADMMWVMS